MPPTNDNNNIDDFLSHHYTHIIVGGGTAGLVVATRLSENPDLVVGILEAGPAAFDDPRINVPGRYGETLGTELDWQFATTKQPGLGGRSIPFNRGKVLGGSSALNFMTWNRGCKEDYDAWEKLGAEGWGWEGMLPFFKKPERFHPPDSEAQLKNGLHFNEEFHGKDGPFTTSYGTDFSAAHQHWEKTLNNAGIDTCASNFAGSNVGCWTALTGITPDLRQRCYSATAYYKPNAGRPNLKLLTGAMAREVILEKVSDDWVAKGVRFAHGDQEHVAKTSGEVIVCGGSVQSPQLLELSGVGDPEILKAAGIECKVANPYVGENLQEHMMTTMLYEIDPNITTPEDIRNDPELSASADKVYAESHSGPRTIVPSSVCYLPFSHFMSKPQLEKYNSQLLAQSTPTSLPKDKILSDRLLTDKNLGQIEFYFDVSNFSPYYAASPDKKYATMLMMLQYPFSVGTIHIPPANWQSGSKRTTSDDYPTIDPKYYEGIGGQIDFEIMKHSQAFAHRICETQPLKDILVRRVYPAEEAGSEPEDFAQWVTDATITDWHPVGTCAMGGKGGSGRVGAMGGKEEQERAMREGYVCDSRLRVYGVKGLRVCDASVMPLQIAAHLQATVYAIGEKGAEMCKEDWVGRRGEVVNGQTMNGSTVSGYANGGA